VYESALRDEPNGPIAIDLWSAAAISSIKAVVHSAIE
jgi:hypothetical protein